MTEQEKREKAIEEMCDCACSNCKHFPQCDDITCEEIIKALYDAGYRKEEEVRKETAKRVLTMIASDFYSIGGGFVELTEHDIQELRQEFGVEVEG